MSYIHRMNIAALNLNLLPVLDALLTERSVSRAGARLGLSQPAVSNALAQLRALLKDPLLVRKAGGMEPTDRALALAGPLRAALLAVEQGLDPPGAFDPAAAERDFTIATNDFVAFAMLPRLLSRLQHEAPRVRLQVRAWQENPEDLYSRQETRSLVEREILKLPSKYRVVIMLRDIEQLPASEVCEILGLGLAAVKARLFRARLMVRDALAPRFALRTGRSNT